VKHHKQVPAPDPAEEYNEWIRNRYNRRLKPEPVHHPLRLTMHEPGAEDRRRDRRMTPRFQRLFQRLQVTSS
jgi:hypothetical protein